MKYQPHATFSAQAISFMSLMRMYDAFKSDQSDDPFDYMPLLVFSAFTTEAYINSIGSRKIKFWEQLERLPWRAKVEVLHAYVHKTPDWSRDPLQFACRIFGIRDRLAHGRSETVSGPKCDDYNTAISILYVQHLKPSIFDGLDREWILGSAAKLYALLGSLAALYNLRDDDFASFSQGRVQEHS